MRTIPDTELSAEVTRLGDLLRALGRKQSLRDPISAAVEKTKLTPAQVHCLLWLGGDGPLTMGDLARRLCITEKTITGVVDRLARAEYVQRERGDADRRVVRCRLTRKGGTLYRRLNDHIFLKLKVLLSILDTEDRGALFRILQKISDRLPGSHPPPALKEAE